MEAGNEGFKIPIPPARPTPPVDVDDSVDSSGESVDSADEVEANLISVGIKSEREDVSDSFSDSSASDSDPSSDSDSDNVRENDASKKTPVKRRVADEDDEDDEEGDAVAAAVTLRTKNELPEPDIMIPPIAQVEPDEQLEKVGEIMNIVNNNVVVVKGEASSTRRASEHALDSETLLVYEDRKVLGYIHETFGPTYQPMYQVKFNSAHPLDLNEARVSRPVFHVPARSKYVFVTELTKLRGSDASNVHDEEPAEYELEFSDDEAEATYKAKLRERRHGSREPSVPASPAHMRDQDLDAWNPYAEHGAYDMDYGTSPSRPAPQPYDDPYSDAYNQPGASTSVATSVPTLPPRPGHGPGGYAVRGNRGRGRGRDDHRPHHHRERGRGRSRGCGRGRGRGHPPHRAEEHGPQPLSPPSPIIAQAVGQSPIPNASYPGGGGGSSDYTSYSPQLQQFGFAQPYTSSPQPFVSPQHSVQPHINPRFAGQFGLNLDMMQQQQQQSYFAYGQYGTQTTPVYDNGAEGGWDGQWSQGYGTGSGGEHHDGSQGT
ncbi:NAF1-domain-containing protein [Lactarius akahatsu]|uniref:H/ACA ribonucleoprotein complex non-core subunit NAF1 n=1 Tax=Lactarius akahatsu TaxID=416441 RepID=A0AAD4LLY6_9AGAM|nr:NAF1-domain-containing protein [Lactarius akahatsu]